MSNVFTLTARPKQPWLMGLYAALHPRTFQYPELVLGWTESPSILHLLQLQGEDPHLDLEVVEENSGEIGLYVMAGLTSAPYPLFAEFGCGVNVLRHFDNWLILRGHKGEDVGPGLLVMSQTLQALLVPETPSETVVVELSAKK